MYRNAKGFLLVSALFVAITVFLWLVYIIFDLRSFGGENFSRFLIYFNVSLFVFTIAAWSTRSKANFWKAVDYPWILVAVASISFAIFTNLERTNDEQINSYRRNIMTHLQRNVEIVKSEMANRGCAAEMRLLSTPGVNIFLCSYMERYIDRMYLHMASFGVGSPTGDLIDFFFNKVEGKPADDGGTIINSTIDTPERPPLWEPKALPWTIKEFSENLYTVLHSVQSLEAAYDREQDYMKLYDFFPKDDRFHIWYFLMAILTSLRISKTTAEICNSKWPRY